MVWKKIKIEKDCEACLIRAEQNLHFYAEHKAKYLGTATCPECFREFAVITYEDPIPEKP